MFLAFTSSLVLELHVSFVNKSAGLETQFAAICPYGSNWIRIVDVPVNNFKFVNFVSGTLDFDLCALSKSITFMRNID